MEKPIISVIMAVFNGEEYIKSAVDSILSQTFGDFELIVVNDGSQDNTLKILQSFTDDRMQVISNSKNEGLAKSLNTGISRARGHYIARQDADDISLPQRLQKQFDYMQRYPKIAVLGTARKTMLSDGSVKLSSSPLESPTFEDLLKKSFFVHGSVMLRKDSLEKVSGYNEIFHYTEDYDLWLRLAKEAPVANLSEPLYVIRRHEDRITLKNLSPAVLYRLLARNLALDEAGDNIIQKIQEEGIEAYYNHLSKQDKIFYHHRAGKRYMNYRYDQQALKHYQQLVKLQGASFKSMRNLLILKLRLLFKR